MLHVTNGDSAAITIAQTGVAGTVLPWRDVLHEGPLTPGLDLDTLSTVRARFLAECHWGDFESIQRDMLDRNAALREAGEVTLWFEHDLYDQLQLLQILDALSDTRATVEMVCIGAFPGVYPFYGLGQLSVEQMATLWPQRVPVRGEQYDVARRVWPAVRAGRVSEVLDTDLTALPFVSSALHRLVEEQPSGPAGLSRTERQILEAVAAGARTFTGAFHANQAMEQAPFLGDTVFRTRVQRLQALPEPLITAEPYRLTAAGEKVRALQ